ncbi:MAG: T9SS type A sorting domain-containing protein, partial [Flavobacteriales bacterium]|nr:T9SS type A sorting domain-containing protein [Flavobacteriales bacterium]
TIDANATVEYNGTMAQTVLPGIDYGHLSFDNGSSNAKQVLEDVTVSGDLTISDDATLYLDAVELVLEGNLDNQGTIDPTQSLLTLNGSSKTITGPVNLHSLDVNGSYTVATGTTTMSGDFYVETTGSIDFGNNDAVLDGNLTNKGSIISNGTATFTGTQVQTIQLLNAISSSSTGVINFNGTVAPFISSTSSPNFATVNINNTGGITPSVPWNVFVACNIAAGASFNGGPLTHTFYGDFDNQGSVTSSGNLVFMPGAPYSASATIALGGTSFTSSGDVVFAGTAPITLTSGTTPTFQHITISNQDPSGVTAPQSWTVSDEILVNSGAILNGGVATLHNIGTSLLVNGTLEGGTSRFSFTGATSSIDGIGTTNFNDLDIDPGATLTLNKDISLTGDFVNDGTFSPAGRNVRFTGSSQSAITGITGSVTFGDLEIDKTSTDVVLNVPVDVVDQLTLTDGIITTTTTNILTIRDNGVSDEGSSTSYVEGPMKKIGDDAFVFPLGDGGKWARLGITAPSSTTDEFRAEFIDVAYSDTTSMATSPTPVLNNVSQHEYWELDRLVGSSSVSVELFWENAAASGINDFSDDLVIAHWTGSDWENVGQSSISGGNIGSVTSDPVSSFSPFTFGSKSPSTNPLPIELVAFDAILEGGRVIITWTTASEINNDYFTIERSKDGRDWEIVNEVPGAGFSSGLLHYEDIDIMPFSGLSYYRLKQTDFDGSFEYSDIRAVYNGLTESLEMKVYPNPTNGVVNIIADVENISGFTVSTLLGRDVSAEVDLIESSSSVHRIDLSNLSSGIYILKFETSAVKIHKH